MSEVIHIDDEFSTEYLNRIMATSSLNHNILKFIVKSVTKIYNKL